MSTRLRVPSVQRKANGTYAHAQREKMRPLNEWRSDKHLSLILILDGGVLMVFSKFLCSLPSDAWWWLSSVRSLACAWLRVYVWVWVQRTWSSWPFRWGGAGGILRFVDFPPLHGPFDCQFSFYLFPYFPFTVPKWSSTLTHMNILRHCLSALWIQAVSLAQFDWTYKLEIVG